MFLVLSRASIGTIPDFIAMEIIPLQEEETQRCTFDKVQLATRNDDTACNDERFARLARLDVAALCSPLRFPSASRCFADSWERKGKLTDNGCRP